MFSPGYTGHVLYISGQAGTSFHSTVHLQMIEMTIKFSVLILIRYRDTASTVRGKGRYFLLDDMISYGGLQCIARFLVSNVIIGLEKRKCEWKAKACLQSMLPHNVQKVRGEFGKWPTVGADFWAWFTPKTDISPSRRRLLTLPTLRASGGEWLICQLIYIRSLHVFTKCVSEEERPEAVKYVTTFG